MAEETSYTDALGELDSILRSLESPDVDVDRLADRVRRASELIKLCRERIARAELEVEQLVVDLESSGMPVDDDGKPL